MGNTKPSFFVFAAAPDRNIALTLRLVNEPWQEDLENKSSSAFQLLSLKLGNSVSIENI